MRILSFLGSLVPSFARFSLILKIVLTIFLCGICTDLFYAKINPAIPLLKGALTFSPVKYAESLVEEGKLKTAEEYIDFYVSIPGHYENSQLIELRNKIHSKRTGVISGTLHQGKHILKGFKGEESDEVAGQAADIALGLSSFSDARDLYTEWCNYSTGKEVDKLSAGMAGIGLTMTLADLAGNLSGLVTSGMTTAATHALITPIKYTVLTIRKSLKLMNPKLRKACNALFEPVFINIRKMNLLEKLPLPKMPSGSMKEKLVSLKSFTESDQFKAYLRKNYDNFLKITEMVKGKLGNLSDTIALAKRDPYAAKLVLQNSTSMKEMESLSKMALSLGKEGGTIFHFGGTDALKAMKTLGKQGKLSDAVMKQSMRVGETGLKAVAKGCWGTLDKMAELAIQYQPLLKWYMLQSALSRIPMSVIIAIELFIMSILIKTWGGFIIKNKNVQANSVIV